MQHHGWLEAYIQAAHPDHDLVFRNLGFPGDEVTSRIRSDNFGSPDQWLSKTGAGVVFCFFGYNESLRGEDGLGAFRHELAEMIDGMRAQQYDGRSGPRLVVFSPIAHENLHSAHLPDGSRNNHNLAMYTDAMAKVCSAKEVTFVELFSPSLTLYERASQPLTMNGIHLLDHGNRAIANVIMHALFGDNRALNKDQAEIVRLRDAVLDKNLHWFSRYRVVDGYNVFGGRSKLAWFGQSNADVMMREMEIFDVMTANRDKRIWSVARGGDLTVADDNLPPELVVETNKAGELESGKFSYLGGVEAINKMRLADGMQVNLFASEEMFPEIINPVQMAVDTDGRLFASVWPSYPHWTPARPRTDRIVVLPDEDRDGVADECVVFADKLNSITGFEFWGGGMLVAAPPEIWFLQDTDRDDRADVKIRMLQGVSSADSHHSANAVVIGPDGGLYWSRGIFNTASMETPTQKYQSTKSGVHRFDPRTFEMSFEFPIGPNPHGHVIDQWGYQFVNDGTSGTGSYLNIGKGIGNKQWFEKRVRPVAATGILSSRHFPDENNGNFLICNTIGFLGVLQYEVRYNGADITAHEIEPILVSSDPNFRPTDIEIGGDGALYVSDWSNALIGHMQHNIRDPNRDHAHGRIYRVTYQGRPLLEPVKLKGKQIERVCEAFYAKENGTRYRARLELSGRQTSEVVDKVAIWASRLDPADAADAQALLECLWVFEEHRVPNLDLLQRVLQTEEPRIRAAAIRTLGHWGPKVEAWEPILLAAAGDDSALVRAEAVKAAIEFTGLKAAQIIFEVATRPTDSELDYVLNYARGQIDVDQLIRDSIRSDRRLSPAATAFAFRNASIDALLKLEPTLPLYQAILTRADASAGNLQQALDGLAHLLNAHRPSLLLDLIADRDRNGEADQMQGPAQLLVNQPAAELRKVRNRLEQLSTSGREQSTRRIAYAAWMVADGNGDAAFFAASKSKESLRDLLEAVPAVSDEMLRGDLYDDVRALAFDLPPNLKQEPGSGRLQQPGIQVDYFHPSAANVALETLAKLKPQASGIVPEIVIDVPQRVEKDRFALRFTGVIQIDRAGKYRFYTESDDGSRLYIGDQLVVNNDGLHGMVEQRGTIDLTVGLHPMIVTYFDNGGGEGLKVSWSGPGFRQQPIPADRLAATGGTSLHDIAIRTLVSIPGHEEQKVRDLARLIKAGKHRAAAIRVLRQIPIDRWPQQEVRPIVENLVAYLTEIPVKNRTGPAASTALTLAESLTARLPAALANATRDRLQNLNVRIIAIGTVPTRMIYDKERIFVQAGKPVEFRFSNSDHMPHNFAITLPGALEEVGLLAEATARDPDAMARQYIPKSDKILVASLLLQPGQDRAISFEVPHEPGVYPYVCTYPGHWRRMYGALYVVADLEAYQANPDNYLAANSLPLRDELLKYMSRNTQWRYDDLASHVTPLSHGRSFEVGQNLFKVANCTGCHKMNGEGQQLGPDLTKLEPKRQTAEHILRSLLEPSKDIDEKYQSHLFILDSGRIVTGMIVEETEGEVKVLVDPLAKAPPVAIKKAEIDERDKSPNSIMPQGMLSKLTQEEILDLIAYVLTAGNEKHMLFKAHDH
jgi:putative heme-binding domain-containing protein